MKVQRAWTVDHRLPGRFSGHLIDYQSFCDTGVGIGDGLGAEAVIEAIDGASHGCLCGDSIPYCQDDSRPAKRIDWTPLYQSAIIAPGRRKIALDGSCVSKPSVIGLVLDGEEFAPQVSPPRASQVSSDEPVVPSRGIRKKIQGRR